MVSTQGAGLDTGMARRYKAIGRVLFGWFGVNVKRLLLPIIAVGVLIVLAATSLPTLVLLKIMPKMHKATAYPPHTEDEKRMWRWWRVIRSVDPSYEWKMPIEFYGVVLDQSNMPVANATAQLQWTGMRGTGERILESDSSGRFCITGIRGKRLVVEVQKPGCVSSREARKSFEYASFYDKIYYVPDALRPVKFRLWRLINPEPMYQGYRTGTLSTDGKVYWLDFRKGKISDAGDLGFSVIQTNAPSISMPAYTVTIQAAPGGGILLCQDEELMFEAPCGGYESSITITQKAGEVRRRGANWDPSYQKKVKLKLYVRTADRKYAAIETTIDQGQIGGAYLGVMIYFNPSGNRNLEYDYHKRIRITTQ